MLGGMALIPGRPLSSHSRACLPMRWVTPSASVTLGTAPGHMTILRPGRSRITRRWRKVAAKPRSKDFDAIEQDDWGGAAWVSIGPSGGAAYFNANPGFEYDPDPFMHWYRSSTSQITGQSYAAKTGDVGAQFASIRELHLHD